MRPLFGLLLLLLAGFAAPSPTAAQPVGIAWYDVDRLYDTLPSPFYDDTDYTPAGRLHWSAERYRRKCRDAAAAIDSMALPLVALCGVENEAVVRDLARNCRGDYSYLHRTLNSLDGLDCALLYYGDRFFPHLTEPGNGYLYVEGTLAYPHSARCDTIGILCCRRRDLLTWLGPELQEDHPSARLVVLGQFESREARSTGLQEATRRAERAGRGNRYRNGGWIMRDRAAADSRWRVISSDVFIRRWQLDPDSGTPDATYDNTRYRGGRGRYLPLFLYIEPAEGF